MKFFSLLLFAGAAVAQVPAHSVVGNVTIDVVDVSIPVAYGAAEMKAAISICTNMDSTYATVYITYLDGTNLDVSAKFAKVDSAYCGVVVAAGQRKDMTAIVMQEARVSTVSQDVSKVPPAPSANHLRK